MLAQLGLRVNASGAIRQMGKFTHSASNAGRATEKFERSTRNLTATLGVLGGFFGVRRMVEYADTWTLISARIRVTTKDMTKQRAIQMRLFDISQKTRNTLAATAVLYTRVALNADQLGRSSEELLKVTEAVNAATLLSGSTGVEAAQSIRQLAQAMSKGKLDGDEFRTVMEAMPLVARALADEMGVSIGELQRLAPQGLLTVQDLIDALLNKHEEFVAAIEEMPFTIGQTIEVLNNAMTMQIGILNQAAGITDTVGEAMRWLADNIDRVISAVAGLVATLITYKATLISVSIVQTLITGVAIVARWYTLARAVGVVAATVQTLRNSITGIAGFVAMIASAGVGLIVYKRLLAETQRATQEWIDAQEQANLLDPLGLRVDPEAANAQKIRDQITDMVRLAHQTVVLAGLTDEAADRQAIAFDAINKRIEARRDLTDDLVVQMEKAINLEEELAIVALEVEAAIKAQQDALAEAEELINRFLKNVQRSFADTFEKIFDEGISKFEDLFKSIKKLFVRLMSEMAAAKMMQTFGKAFETSLEGIFGVTAQQEAIQQAAIAAAALATSHTAAASIGGAPATERTQTMISAAQKEAFGDVIALEEIIVTVENGDDLGKKFTKHLAPAIGGFMVGQMIGSMTTNKALGTLGGAAGGAAMGFAMGGPVGAVVGGIAGAIGGFLGASKAQKEAAEALAQQLERNRQALMSNSLTLLAMQENFRGQVNKRLQSAGNVLSGFGNLATKTSLIPLNHQTIAQITAVAKDLGITIFDEAGNIIQGTLLQLNDTIKQTIIELTQFGGSLSDQLQLQSNFNKIFGIEETPKQQLIDAQTIMNQFAPELMRQLGLTNLNLDTTAGRETLLAGLREMFTMITEGNLTLDLLGSFADKDQLIDMILKAVGALDEFNKVLLNVTTDFPRAMDLVHYEQLYGSFGTNQANLGNSGSNSMSTTSTTWGSGTVSSNAFNIDSVTIINEGDESGEELLAKLESAVITRRTRGGTVDGFYEEGGWD